MSASGGTREYDPERLDASREFSVSRLETYKDCPRQYHYRYLDRLPRKTRSVEAVLGSCVHAALERLYLRLMRGRAIGEEEALSFFEESWEKAWAEGPVVIHDPRTGREDWRRVGVECVKGYHRAHAPFDQDRTVAVEMRVSFPLELPDPDSGGAVTYRIEGVIDRLAVGRDGVFEIHDYKTSGRLPPQAQLDEDWQLGVYQLAVAALWPHAPPARLVWHYLRFGARLTSSRTAESLALLTGRLGERIKTIKRERAFEPVKSPLCDWCDYRDICPVWKHVAAFEALPADERRSEAGVRLVDSYAALDERRRAIKEDLGAVESEMEDVARRLVRYAEAHGVVLVAGSGAEAEVQTREEYRFPTRSHDPEKVEAIEARLRESPVWDEVSRLDSRALMEGFREGRWPPEVMALVSGWLGRWIRQETVRHVRLHRRPPSEG